MSKVVLGLEPTEMDALHKLAEEQDLSYDKVLLQALRLYHQHNQRLADGETQTWSGDAERARAFAGDLVPRFTPLELAVLDITTMNRAGRVTCAYKDLVNMGAIHPILRELHERNQP